MIGCAASIGSAIAAAIGSNYARAYLRDVGSWEQTIGAFLIGGLMVLPLLFFVPMPRMPLVSDLIYLLALAGFCSALAYVLYFRLVADLGATTAISVEFLVTVIAVAVGALVLNEELSVAQLVGGATIIIGCALVLGFGLTRRRRSTSALRS
jgi:drug/metabolite transporter (DMT)-like permease